MSLLSFFFPSLRKPKPFFAPPPRPPMYQRGTRVWAATARCWGNVAEVETRGGKWLYFVDLDSHEDYRRSFLESDLSLHETHPHWKIAP